MYTETVTNETETKLKLPGVKVSHGIRSSESSTTE